MRVIIAGSRTITDYFALLRAIKNSRFDITAVVSGTARGVDELGERFAGENSLELLRYPAEWNKYGKKAGYLRNKEMAEAADALIALWDGTSHGTRHMINIMRDKHKPVYAVIPTRVVHCKKEKYDVYIGRPSEWGNPFVGGRDGTREEVIEKYRKYLIKNPLIEKVHELRGKTLGCWCRPRKCHGDILAEYAGDMEV